MFREFDYENKPVTEIVDEIIDSAVDKGVSDIHFDPDPNGIRLRMRIDGDLHDYCYVPDSVKRNLTTRVKIISGMNITEMRLPQDGAIKKMYGDQQVDMRVSSLPTIYGEKIVIRILDYSRSLAGLETLGFSDHNLQLIEGVIKSPNGIILLAGATGSGKSTTVYSILSRLNQPEKNIITVEDPVEMKMKGLNQVQVMSEIGLDFNATLRSILRQDPDTIMIGEIRDGETARIAVRASITGHLVLSTIHTNNSLNTIERLLDMDVERYLLGTSLNGIISQRLCKGLCPKCKKKRPTTAYEKNLFSKVIHQDVPEIYEPVGCDECFSGYKSRIAVHEVLVLNQEIRDAITNNMNKEDLRKLVYNGKDTLTLLEDGLAKVVNGATSIDECLRIISVEDDFGDSDSELKNAFVGKGLAETKLEDSSPKEAPATTEESNATATTEEPNADTTPVDIPKEETKTEDATKEAPKEETNVEENKPADIVTPEVKPTEEAKGVDIVTPEAKTEAPSKPIVDAPVTPTPSEPAKTETPTGGPIVPPVVPETPAKPEEKKAEPVPIKTPVEPKEEVQIITPPVVPTTAPAAPPANPMPTSAVVDVL